MDPNHRKPATAHERRKAARELSEASIRLTIEGTEFDGRAENVSRTGALFFTEERLRVTVECEKDGKRTVREGFLSRLQAMRGHSTGWAVEFDDEPASALPRRGDQDSEEE